MDNKNNDFLGTAPINKLIWKLALPTLVAQLINMLYNMVDRIYIGHIPNVGPAALTGVGVCLPLIIIISSFAALINYGGAPRASIFMGKGDNKSAEAVLGNCFMLQIIVSVILTIGLWLFNEPILMMFGASENTISYALQYMNIYVIGTIFVQLTLGMNAFANAQGFTKITMKSVILGAVTNIILDPIFIFGLKMGVKGAALATILSQALSTLWIMNFILRGDSILRIRKENLRLKSNVIMPALALGLSSFIMQISESIIAICFNASLQRYGGDIAVGAMTILGSVMQLAMMPLSGFGQGAQPIISYNYGKNNSKRVKEAFMILLKICFGYSLSLWAFIELLPNLFIKMFTSEAALIDFTRPALRIYVASVGLFGIQIACQFAFNAIGNAKASIIVAVMRKFILLIPLIYIMPHLWSGHPTTAIYLAEPIADFLSVTFTAILFTNQFRKTIRQMKEA